tara:strand:+ start:252 stop:695 length:444 start_codon:yes stop_codon:yes gene_type:complete
MSQFKDLFDNKKVVIFGLPGAFTPTCSAAHLPGYEELYDDIKKCGVDEVYCVSVNDEFVMKAWFEKQEVSKVKYIADGNGDLTNKLNMLVTKKNKGFGSRSWRYSAVLQDGQIVKTFEEEGKCNECDVDNDPFECSDAKTMLSYLQG